MAISERFAETRYDRLLTVILTAGAACDLPATECSFMPETFRPFVEKFIFSPIHKYL